MKQTSGPTKKAPAEAVLKDIRRATRRQFTAEEKIRIVLEGLRGEERASRCQLNSAGDDDCGSTTARASGSGPNARTMCGLTTSSRTGRMTGASSGC